MVNAFPLPANCLPADALLAWYDRHARKLPWRAVHGLAKPYDVWLSEIMLQQTGVKTVAPYFLRFLARWPDVNALADADLEDVLREWAGLGYYSRARSLHACARKVVQDFDGQFPREEAMLLQLPGIGPYTAAAISAIAFGQRAVVVDGNVERVVSRLFAIERPMPQAKPDIRARTEQLTPQMRAGDFAQAMMDLGATLCTPTRPACTLCPLADFCLARVRGDAASFPRKAAKKPRPNRRGAVFYLRRADGMVLVRTRPARGLLGGMTEFPGTSWDASFDPGLAALQSPISGQLVRVQGEVLHIFTHFALALTVFVGDAPPGIPAPAGARWVAEAEIGSLALPTLMRKVAAKAGAMKKAMT